MASVLGLVTRCLLFGLHLGVLIALCLPSARAAGTVASANATVDRYYTLSGYSFHATSVSDACAQQSAAANALNNGYTYSCVSTTACALVNGTDLQNCSYTRRVTETANSANWTNYTQTAFAHNDLTAAGCPANSTLAGGTCTCNVDYYPNAAATACVTTVGTSTEACQQVANQRNSAADPRLVSEALTPPVQISTCVRYSGCSLRGTMAALNYSGLSYTVWGPYVVDGTCSSSAVGTAGAGIECPTGQVQTTVNSQTVCVPSASQSSSGTSTTTAPAGAGSAPAGTLIGSRQTDVTCTGAGCTTVTTTRDSTGAVTAVTSETKPRESFCAENPEVSICEESTFSTACSGGAATVACTGDAIQCAIAREQHARNCAWFESTHADAVGGLSEINAGSGITGPVGTALGTPGNPYEVDVGEMLSMPANPYSAACLSDIVYTTSFGVITIPLAAACPAFVLMGQMAVAFTLLSAAGWLVMKGSF